VTSVFSLNEYSYSIVCIVSHGEGVFVQL
jgi:hypothetical protein